MSNPPEQDPATRRLARGTGFMFAGNLIGKVVSLVLQLLLTRTLGRAAYGLYTLGMSVLRISREIAALGLQGGIVRFGAAEHAQDDQEALIGTLRTALLLAGLAALAVAAGLYGASGWMATVVFDDPAMEPVLHAFSGALPFAVMVYIISRGARAFHQMHYDVGISVILPPVFNLVFVAIAFALGYRLGGALTAFIASMAVTAVIGGVLLGRLFPPLVRLTAARYRPRELLGFSLPVLGASLASLVVEQADRLMLGALSTSANVGLYTVAALAATQIRFTLHIVASTFMPTISDLYETNQRERLHRLFKMTTRWIVTLSLPLAAALILFSTPIVRLFGPDFAPAAATLQVLAVAFLVDTLVGASGLMLQMCGRERLAMWNNVILAVLNVGLNAWLILAYGLIGAAIATGLSIAMVNILKLLEVRYILRMTPFSWHYAKPFVAALGAGGVGWGLHALLAPHIALSWIVGLMGLGLAYLALLLVLGLPDDDWAALTPLLRRLGLPVSDDA